MEQDFEELKSKMENKVKESFEFAPFFHHNLNNFAHRYFESPLESKEAEDGSFLVTGFDTKLKDYIKSPHEKIKTRALHLAQNVPYKDGPKIELSLRIKVLETGHGGSGKIEVSSRVHFGFPDFSEDRLLFEEKKVELKFEDIIILRNQLAKSLETACQLFP